MNIDYKLDLIDLRVVNIYDYVIIHEINEEWFDYILSNEYDIKMNIEFIEVINLLFNKILIKPPKYDVKKKIEMRIERIIDISNMKSYRYMRELTRENIEYYINKKFRESEYICVLDDKFERIRELDIGREIKKYRKYGYVHEYVVRILREIGLRVFSIMINEDNSIMFDYVNIRFPIFIYNV